MHLQNEKSKKKLSELLNSDFSKKELREGQKHEIIMQISKMIDGTPKSINKAEEIFNNMKYDIARYILNHEYSAGHGIEDNLVFWLEEKSDPGKVDALNQIIDQYLK